MAFEIEIFIFFFTVAYVRLSWIARTAKGKMSVFHTDNTIGRSHAIAVKYFNINFIPDFFLCKVILTFIMAFEIEMQIFFFLP